MILKVSTFVAERNLDHQCASKRQKSRWLRDLLDLVLAGNVSEGSKEANEVG